MATASRDIPVRFALATQADDAALRRLLRENPMRGRISVSLEREPDYFAAAAVEGEHQTIVAYEGDRLVCAGNVSVRERFINGKPMRVGYLGGLRLDSSCRGRASIVRRGYEMFRELHEAGGPPIYLSSIAEDNEPARRLLEAGIRGMPTYRFLGRFVTLVMRAQRIHAVGNRHWLRGKNLGIVNDVTSAMSATELILRRVFQSYQFAPVWPAIELVSATYSPELRGEDWIVLRDANEVPRACCALWDQRAFKQTVVRGYAPMLRRLRWLINLAGIVINAPSLPRIGSVVRSAFISHFAADQGEPDQVHGLICELHGMAARRGIDYLMIGFDVRDPRLAQVRKTWQAREYVTRLYAVHWDDGAELAASLDDRLLAPEVAIL